MKEQGWIGGKGVGDGACAIFQGYVVFRGESGKSHMFDDKLNRMRIDACLH